MTNYPKTKNGNPKRVSVGLGKGQEAALINCKDFLTSDFTIAASATYLKVSNNIKAQIGVKLFQGATAVASVTDIGISTINSGKSACFTIPLDRVSGSESEVKYEEQITIGGWKVGPDGETIDIPENFYLGGKRYTLLVSGDDYDDMSCAFEKKAGTDEILTYDMSNIN